MSRVGYARVSTADQDLDAQRAKLKAEGCEVIRSEKVSGGSRDGRTELATVLEFMRPGDELVVTRLDRLGRDTRDVLNIVHECERRGASVTVLDPHVSTRGEMGHVVLTVLGMVAQMERRFIKERQREGIVKARAEGVGSIARQSPLCTSPVTARPPSRRRSGVRGCRCTGSLWIKQRRHVIDRAVQDRDGGVDLVRQVRGRRPSGRCLAPGCAWPRWRRRSRLR